MSAERADADRLGDMLRAVHFVRSKTSDGGQAFQHDELVQAAVVHHLQVLGEAAAGVSEGLRERHPEVPWRLVIGMRNQLVHRYFDLDLSVVLQTALSDLPVIEAQINAIIEALELRPGQKVQAMCHGDRVELVPIVPVKQMRGFLSGIDTDVPREDDRL